MSELKEIKLDPENNKDHRDIDNLKKELDGLKLTIKMLSNQIGKVERKMWEKCVEAYPEVKDGVWQMNKTFDDFKLIQVNKD